MMKHNRLSFEILPHRPPENNTSQHQFRKELLQTQDKTLRSLVGMGSNLTVSLRYYYNPRFSKIKTYLLIHPLADSQTDELSEQVKALLTKGKLSKFFAVKQENTFSHFQPLTWVEFIGEVIKNEQFIEPHYYLPHFLESNLAHDMLDVWEVISRLDNRLVLEITFQTYHNLSDKSLCLNAIKETLTQLDKLTDTKDHLLSTTLALYQKYQQLYAINDLLQYNIKVLAENRGEASVVLQTLTEHATKDMANSKPCQIIIAKGEPGFSESLQATENVEISNSIQWSGWQKDFGQKLIREAIQPKKTGWARFGDGSLSLTAKPSLPSSGNSVPNPNPPGGSDIVLRGSSALAKFSSPPPARFVDLKPLSKLATAQELSGFFRVAVPRTILNQDMKANIPVANAEDLFKYYKSRLEEEPDTYRDRYIIGINDAGEPVISSWAETPHRLVAGVPGAGKTNFLNWVIFQFIYANPKGKIYIADFAGVDFNFLVKRLKANVEIITTIEECQQLVEKLHTEEYQRRMNLLNTHEVQNIQQLREEKVDIERTLWIIDEAADIASAKLDLKKQIENRLSEYARKGRKCGIHVIYCTQRPSSLIITDQVLDCCDERVVFRVSETVSELIAETTQAGRIPNAAIGRAFLKNLGGGDNNGFVNTPFIQVPVGKKVNVSDTLWQNCVNLSN
ncbi:FtsK/SpoIIIE domain-containing protein [Laspinema olomoucense]|uniref:FtsK/SpoIIIE domain-containing protein n=1 Tax=Laspinema olomoucense TaxID=3231600 RepID=UPI0021BACF31|nr:FtsK/SpoIIIE domain-containing protein [Laspinema sp. D3c]MCT7994109.1 FtsK/SpoIIIE domain-containing protein [Laspinema sp. D3c]